MGTTPTAELGRRLGDWLDHQRAAHQTDAELIERFVSDRSEAAFAQLVRRHGPGVLAAARRVAGNPHDAEDVFQATFLVLARKAAAVRKREAVGGWLFAVAARLAARVRADGRKREAGGDVAGVPAPAADAPGFDVRGVLDEELARLPARYRAVIVLCYLHGKTRAEAAAELGRSPGAVKIWLERGRDLLRGRLARRGVTAPGGLMLAGLLGERATAAVPPILIETTTKAAVSFAAGGGAAGAASAGAVALAAGGLKAMLWAKLKVWGGCVAALGLTAGGGGVAWQTAHAQGTAGGGAGGVRIVRAADADQPAAAAAKPAEPVRERRVVVVADKDAPYATVADVLRLSDAEALAAAIDIDIDIKGKTADEIKKQLDVLIKQLEERKAGAGAKPAAAPEFRRVEVKVAPPVAATVTAKAIAFSPDGKLLAAQEGVTVKVYDAATGKVLWQFTTADGKAAPAQVLPNPPGKPVEAPKVAVATGGGVRVWDVAGGSDPATVSALERLAKSNDPETAKLAAELLKRVTAAKPAVAVRAVAVPKPPAPGAPAAAPKPPAPPIPPANSFFELRVPFLQDRIEAQRAEAEAQRRLAEEAMKRAAEQADLARAAEAKARAEAERAKALLEAEAAKLSALRKTETRPVTPPAAANPGLDALKAELDALRKKIEAMEKATPKK